MLQQLVLAMAVGCLGVNHQPTDDVNYNPAKGVAAPTINPIETPKIDRLVIPVTIDPIKGRRLGNKPLEGKTPLGTATESPDGLILALTGVAAQLSKPCASAPYGTADPVKHSAKPTTKPHKPLRH